MSLATIQISPARLAIVPARIVLIAAAAFVVLVPSLHLLTYLGTYDGQRLLEILLLIGFAGAVLLHTETRLQVSRLLSEIPRVTGALLVSILFLSAVSAAFAARPVYAFLELGHLVLLVLALCVLTVEFRRDATNFSRLVIGAVLFTVALYSVRVAFSFVGHLAAGFPLWPQANSGFIHPRYFNQLQTWTLPFVALAVVQASGRGGVRTSLALAAASLWWCLLFASGGRGTLIVTLVALAAVAVLFGRRSIRFVKANTYAAAIGFAAFLVLFRLIGDGGASILERGAGDTGRVVLWDAAVRMMGAHPLLGVGPMHYAHATGLEAAHPHNAALQVGAEFGIPVLILVLAVAGIFAASFLRSRHAFVANADATRIAIVAACSAGLLQSMVDGVLVTPVSQVLAVVAFAMLLGSMPRTTDRSVAIRPAVLRLVPAIAVLALGATLAGVSRDFSTLDQRERVHLERQMEAARKGGLKYVMITPRFWQQGWIGEQSDSRVSTGIVRVGH